MNNLARQHDGLATELEVDSDLNPASDLDRFTGRYEETSLGEVLVALLAERFECFEDHREHCANHSHLSG